MHVGARRRALVPVQHRVHPPHQRPRLASTTCAASSSTPSYLVLGPGRRLPRRAGRHAARPAPPAGHHQVQPGAHLDAGERGRHRRRLPVRLRHGGPGRLPVRRPHAARCGTAIAQTRGVRAGHALAAALLRPDPLLPGRAQQELLDVPRRRSRAARLRLQIEDDDVPLRRLPRVPARPRGVDRRVQARQQAAFDAERERWAALPPPPEPPTDAPSRRRRRRSLPPGATAVRADVTGSVWQLLVKPGDRVRAGDRAASSSRP